MKQMLFNEITSFATVIGNRRIGSTVRCDWNGCGCSDEGDGRGNCICRD